MASVSPMKQDSSFVKGCGGSHGFLVKFCNDGLCIMADRMNYGDLKALLSSLDTDTELEYKRHHLHSLCGFSNNKGGSVKKAACCIPLSLLLFRQVPVKRVWAKWVESVKYGLWDVSWTGRRGKTGGDVKEVTG